MAREELILVVEDDEDLQELICLAGEKRSYAMNVARNGLEAKALLVRGVTPAVIVLDINMPGMDGFAFCRWLREEHPTIPVIFLSARAQEYDKILALEIGGDDYLTKPFSMKELFARIAVSLRRVRLLSGEISGGSDDARTTAGDLVMDGDRWTCTYRGQDVVLTTSEFRILRRLVTTPDFVLGRDRLAEAAFPDDKYNIGRGIDVHVHRIRAKLRNVDPGFDSIETIYQMGYKWKS